jgi:uncharacterized protein (DUF1684 family)
MYTPQQAIEAIKARENGEWDNEQLVKLGPLLTDTKADIMRILALATEVEPETNWQPLHVITVTFTDKAVTLRSYYYQCYKEIQYNDETGSVALALDIAQNYLMKAGFDVVGRCAGRQKTNQTVSHIITTTFKDFE